MQSDDEVMVFKAASGSGWFWISYRLSVIGDDVQCN